MLTLKLAFRGLWRHRMRTMFTLIAVAFGHLFLLVTVSLSEGGLMEMVEIAIRQGTAGHVVVQAEGYQKTAAVELVVEDGAAVRKRIRTRLPQGRILLRVFGGGLASTASDSIGIRFTGVEPRREGQVSVLAKHLIRGVYLDASAADVKRARARLAQEAVTRKAQGKPAPSGHLDCLRPPRPGEPDIHPVVIGARLAETLRVDLCGGLRLQAQGLGAQEQQKFHVVGIFQTGNETLDGYYVHLRLSDAQRLLRLGHAVHQVAVILDSQERTRSVAAAVRDVLRDDSSLAVLTWDKAMPEMAEFIAMKKSSGWVFIFIVMLIMAIGVLNTVLMSVMERVREFGVMRALGAGPGRILGLVLTEGALLGLLGVTLGLLISWPLIHYLETTGIVYPKPMSAVGVTVTSIKARLELSTLVYFSLGLFLTTVAATLMPALRAARVKVLSAVHQA